VLVEAAHVVNCLGIYPRSNGSAGRARSAGRLRDGGLTVEPPVSVATSVKMTGSAQLQVGQLATFAAAVRDQSGARMADAQVSGQQRGRRRGVGRHITGTAMGTDRVEARSAQRSMGWRSR
jgi:hypothetical protein